MSLYVFNTMTNYMATSMKLVLCGKTIETSGSYLMIFKLCEMWGTRTDLPSEREWFDIQAALAAEFGTARTARFIAEIQLAFNVI